jgi:lysozyme family protein
MQSSIEQSLDFILRWEGPEINESPGEPGGISKYGVSLTAWQEAGHSGATKDDIRNLTEDQAREFYRHRAAAVRFGDLLPGIDLAVLNLAVTAGPTGAAIILQMTIDAWPASAAIDDATVAALNAADPKIIVHAAGSAWLAWKARGDSTMAGWHQHAHGWINRDRDFRATALAMAAKPVNS